MIGSIFESMGPQVLRFELRNLNAKPNFMRFAVSGMNNKPTGRSRIDPDPELLADMIEV